jgi:hypothetical protein
MKKEKSLARTNGASDISGRQTSVNAHPNRVFAVRTALFDDTPFGLREAGSPIF